MYKIRTDNRQICGGKNYSKKESYASVLYMKSH